MPPSWTISRTTVWFAFQASITGWGSGWVASVGRPAAEVASGGGASPGEGAAPSPGAVVAIELEPDSPSSSPPPPMVSRKIAAASSRTAIAPICTSGLLFSCSRIPTWT
jgi:hypothetical protein